MAGPGHVIADGFGREPSEEDGAGVIDAIGQGVGVLGGDLKVLGRQPVDERQRIGEGVDDDHGAMLAPTGGRGLGPRQRLESAFDGHHHPVGEVPVVGDQDGLGGTVVLGLAEQIGGDPVGIVEAVGEDQDFRRPGDHVDADGAEDLALGGGHIGVAGTDDLVHGGDGFGPESQGADGLGAADAIDLVDAGDGGGGKHQWVDLALRRRHHHGQPPDAGDLGRQGAHQHRRRIGRRAAGNVKPDGGQRPPAPAEPQARLVGIVHPFGRLAAVEIGDAPSRQFQGLEHVGGDGPLGGLDFLPSHGHGFRRQFETVEFAGIGNHRLVALLAHLGENGAHRVVHAGFGFPLGFQKADEGVLEPGVVYVKPRRHRRPRGTWRSSGRSRRAASSRRPG